MSHFSVAVFTDEYTDVEDLLEPFWEELEVEKYVYLTKEEVIEEGKERIKFYQENYKKYIKDKKAFRKKYKTNQEFIRNIKRVPAMKRWKKEKIYRLVASFYNLDMIGKNGDIYATYNPDSKWDWYEIGGRWKDMLLTKKGEKTNSALVKDIDWNKMQNFHTYAVLHPDGEWIEPGKMAWWGVSCATPEEERKFRENYKKDIIEKANKNWRLTIVDCHI